MKVHIDNKGTTESLKAVMEQALADGPVGSLMVLACEENDFTPETLDPVLAGVPVPVFGGMFPSVMYGHRRLCKGSVVVSMERRAEVCTVPGLSDPDTDFEGVLDEHVCEGEFKTLMVFLDGFSTRIQSFVEALYTTFGLEINYLGGGAGSSSLMKRPCVITNDGLMADVAVLAALNMESGVGVRHGWSSIGGPYQVTEAEGRTLISLDWRPAYEVYKSVVEEHSGYSMKDQPFLDVAIAYPFGIAKMGSETVVRDPIGLGRDGKILCVGEVPVGEYVDVLHGRPDDLINASAQALELAREAFPGTAEPELTLFIDCLSRAMFLKDDYEREIAAAQTDEQPTVGICSIGEIANNGRDYLEFYNKTSVIAFLEGEE